MTDLRHVAQLLHEAGATEGVGPTAMANWLGRRIRDADRDSENEERTRRLESDAQAVQVITIHRSKGLEFPIVLFPYAWDGYIHKIEVPVFHDPDRDHVRTIDVGGPGRELEQHRKLEKSEGQGEALRLFYVALTRAQHQVVLWWARGWDTGDSPLSRLLFDRAPTGEVAPYGMKKARPDDEVETACTALGPRSLGRAGRAPTGARLPEQSEGAGELERGGLRPHPRRGVATRVVFGHHPRRARGAGDRERARGRGDDRRAGRGGLAGPPQRGRRVWPGARRTRPGGHAGRDAGRHDRARGPRADRVRCPRPGRRGRSGARAGADAAQRRPREPGRRHRGLAHGH